MKTFDELLTDINDFGLYQKTKYILICLAGLLPPFATYIHIFLAANPAIKCNTPFLKDDLFDFDNKNITVQECYFYVNKTKYKCDSWEYDKTYYQSTLTEEWNMVCDRNFLRANVQSFYFVGYLFGSLVLGYLSDKYGRRPIMLLSFLLILIGGIGSAFGPQKIFGFLVSYIIYTFSRFLIACGTRGINETGYVLALEMVSQRKRVLTAIGFEHFFALGQLLLVLTAYFIRDWRTLASVFIIPVIPFLSYAFILPESPRWLIQQKRIDEAILILQNAAAVNKKDFDKELWETNINKLTKREQKKETFFTLIKSLIEYPKQSILIITMLFNWIVNNLVFYGVGLKSNDLGINPYISFAISATVEMISFSIVLFLIDKFGRKKIYFLFLFTAGIFCISIMFINNVMASFICAMFGKFAISGSYAILRLYSNEVFPTSIRNSCMGACSTFSRLGVIIAPTINSLGDKTFKSLPFLIFGIFGLTASFSTIFLPETLNRQLPESIEDAHRLNSMGNNKHKTAEETIMIQQLDPFEVRT